ncbi:hypothetical protein ABEO66_06615 [Bacillus pacificus]|uniref:hypothetical protein n=1 Tax=Bacillus pacificus TaxID=2026187 RepID=UPI003D2076FA
MVMFVLNEDGSNFFSFNIKIGKFKVGDIVEREELEGKYVVVHCDPATVEVKPV